MANVLFTRDTLTNIENLTKNPVTDGQLLFDTSGSGKMYMDVGTQRLEMGGAMTIDSKLNSTSTNPIQNKAVGGVMLSTLDEINATTSKGFITDALATRALAQKIGSTDISSIGDGTVTGALSTLNSRSERKFVHDESYIIDLSVGDFKCCIILISAIGNDNIITPSHMFIATSAIDNSHTAFLTEINGSLAGYSFTWIDGKHLRLSVDPTAWGTITIFYGV